MNIDLLVDISNKIIDKKIGSNLNLSENLVLKKNNFIFNSKKYNQELTMDINYRLFKFLFFH